MQTTLRLCHVEKKIRLRKNFIPLIQLVQHQRGDYYIKFTDSGKPSKWIYSISAMFRQYIYIYFHSTHYLSLCPSSFRFKSIMRETFCGQFCVFEGDLFSEAHKIAGQFCSNLWAAIFFLCIKQKKKDFSSFPMCSQFHRLWIFFCVFYVLIALLLNHFSLSLDWTSSLINTSFWLFWNVCSLFFFFFSC